MMRVLDAGAYGIICPMISTPDQATALVSACRYPPIGTRSFGPSRGLLYGAKDCVAHANETVLAIPMIETAEAVKRIDEILEVPGIDMLYMGPNDLAFTLDGHTRFPRPKSEAAMTAVLARAKAKGIPVGIFCADVNEAVLRLDQGYALVMPGNDFGHLTRSLALADRLPASRIVLFGLNPHADDPAKRDGRLALERDVMAMGGGKALATRLGPLAGPDPDGAKSLNLDMAQACSADIGPQTQLSLCRPGALPALSRSIAPICLLTGDKDTQLPLQRAQDAAKVAPDARLAPLLGLGHYAVVEYPAASAAALLSVWDDLR